MSTGSLVGGLLRIVMRLVWLHFDSKPRDPKVTLRRWVAFGLWVLGSVFILWANHFHVTASVIILILGFLAVELAVINLFKTGLKVVAQDDDDNDDSTWGRPLGARAELEREKKALLKAIKEAEFDREMGKLSAKDAEEMIGLYRARAIEVIKELDRLGGGAGSIRDEIEREVKARLELESKAKHAATGAANAAEKKKAAKNNKKNKKAPAAAAKDATAAENAAASPTKEPGSQAAASSTTSDSDSVSGSDTGSDAGSDTDAGSASDSATDSASASASAADEPPPTSAKATAKEATP